MSSMGIGLTTVPKNRIQVLTTGQGIITQNFDRQGASSGIGLVSGTVFFQAVGLLAGDLVSNLSIVVTGAGATTTLTKLGLYDSTGARLQTTANLTTAWESAGTKTHPLSAAYTVATDALYYVAVLFVGTTVPTLHAGSNTGNAASVIGTGTLAYATLAAQSDLPATAALSNSGAKGFWVGVS
jgi:hypothetical protein